MCKLRVIESPRLKKGVGRLLGDKNQLIQEVRYIHLYLEKDSNCIDVQELHHQLDKINKELSTL